MATKYYGRYFSLFKFISFLLVLCLSTQNVLCEQLEWWTEDPAVNNMILASNAMIIADWAQTRYIADHDGYFEKNSDLGMYPTSGDVNRYFVGSLILHNLIGAILPNKYKGTYYTSQFTYRLSVVDDNAEIGIGYKF